MSVTQLMRQNMKTTKARALTAFNAALACIAFGIWQDSLWAGFFMGSVTATLFGILTVIEEAL